MDKSFENLGDPRPDLIWHLMNFLEVMRGPSVDCVYRGQEYWRRYPWRDFNPVPLWYETITLTTEPQWSAEIWEMGFRKKFGFIARGLRRFTWLGWGSSVNLIVKMVKEERMWILRLLAIWVKSDFSPLSVSYEGTVTVAVRYTGFRKHSVHVLSACVSTEKSGLGSAWAIAARYRWLSRKLRQSVWFRASSSKWPNMRYERSRCPLSNATLHLHHTGPGAQNKQFIKYFILKLLLIINPFILDINKNMSIMQHNHSTCPRNVTGLIPNGWYMLYEFTG